MIQNLLNMNGYGFFVWLSFAITFLACGFVYYKTYKTLKKYERDFTNEINKLSELERKSVLKKSKVATQILASYNKSI